MWKILLVDDEELAVEMLEDTLYDRYEVYKATSGAEALEIFKSTPGIGMVISDQRMPGMSGIELFKELKTLNPELSCILLTGYSSLEDAIDAINAHLLNRYLHKPWEEHELLTVVEQEFKRLQANTERDTLQAQLIESGRNHQNLINTLPEIFILFDNKFNISSVNPAAQRDILSKEDRSYCLLDYLDENGREQIHGLLPQLNESSYVSCELVILNQNGHFTNYASSITTYHQQEKQLYALIARDITSHINYEHELEHEVKIRTEALETALDQARCASKAKSQFLSNMSHEIRTPLNGIIGFTEILHHFEMPAQQKELFEHIACCSNLLLKLVNGILDLSKIEAGKMNLDEENFDLRDSLKDVFCSIRPKEDVELILPKLPDPIQLYGDEMRLSQILLNLIGNAMKFTHEGTVTVDMTQKLTGSRMRLNFSISDTGVGIEADQLKSIFKPFTQEDNSTTRHFGGSGLGLAIASELVEMMDGELTVDSCKGEGTKFNFFVYLSLPENAPTIAPLAIERPPILVIEDNHYNVLLMQTILDQLGENYEIASYGPKGLNMAMEKTYRLIFMDLQVPGMDGIEITQHLREAGKSLPIVAVTANIFEEDKDSCLRAGMNDFIAKPVSPSVLKEAIAKYCP